MSLHLYARPRQDNRVESREHVRGLINACEPPESPASQGAYCDALRNDGRRCRKSLPSEAQTWCDWHIQEIKKLNERWDELRVEVEQIEGVNIHTTKQKVVKLRLAVKTRRQIHKRFHTRGIDIVDFIDWIAKLERNVRTLADKIQMSSLSAKVLSDTPSIQSSQKDRSAFENIMILQSPMEPGVPIVSLQGITPDHGAILVLKQFATDLCADAVRQLYHILPDLHYSASRLDSPIQDDSPNGSGARIICSWFRIMILSDSEADVLERATRSEDIGSFLSRCQASLLETYCDFFEKAWRPHAVQYLRTAICAQTLAGGDIKTVSLLGGTIPSTNEGLRMTKPCWDILYRWFPTLFTPWTIASICSNFEDYKTICRLLMIGLYSKHWYDPMSILSECATSVYLGFIPISKGDFATTSASTQDRELQVQSESRNYLCGQMAISDPTTQSFLDELRKRTDRLYLVVYEGTGVDATVHPTEPELFIKRSRSTKAQGSSDEEDWTTTITLKDIKNDLCLRKSLMYDPIVVDSWQFIIIDREVGMPFELIDIVQDTLLMLAGDPSPRQVARSVVAEVIPTTVQDLYLDEMTIECSADLRYPPPPEVQYEGHRYRHHAAEKNTLAAYEKKKANRIRSRDANRFVRRVVADMERHGIVSLVEEYERPQIHPMILQGSDGASDLYFPYSPNETSLTPQLPLPSAMCLLDFAHSFKQAYSNAIMAKGSIQTHYCAWPMPVMKSLGNNGLNFATPEGHIYRWNAMPFDRPWSANAWQYYIQHCINSRYPFVMFYLKTFVICAIDEEDAEDNAATLLEETEDRGWRIVMPCISDWEHNIENLKLETLFEGVKAA